MPSRAAPTIPTEPAPIEDTSPPTDPFAPDTAANARATIQVTDDQIVAGQALRVVYIGPNMDTVELAYRKVHTERGHSVHYVRTVAHVAQLNLAPDVAVINPLVLTPQGIDGACALQAIVPASTVIVALFTTLGSSHTMFTRHALAGRCHPRMLLHYPNPNVQAADIIGQMDRLARGHGGGHQVRTTGHLPPSLIPTDAEKELGQVLSENSDQCRSADDSLTFARLLYAASVNADWSTWGDLASTLGFAEGHVKNTKAKIGRVLTTEVLPDRAEVGVPRQRPNKGGQPTWRIAEFTRFVTEHRSFIRAYCEHHLAYPPVAA